MNAHSEFAPSAAERWLECPGSIAVCRDLPVKESSEYAKEGTAAHELASLCLTSGADPLDCVGMKIEVEGTTFVVDDEMAHYVAIFTNAIIDRIVETGATLYVEQEIDLSMIEPNMRGTGDVILVTPTYIEVHDLKYGRGVQVEAFNNPQLMLYGYGAWRKYGSDKTLQLRLQIHQPRLDHCPAFVIEPLLLVEFVERRVKPAIENALSDNPTFHPGETQCRWCPYLPLCPAAAKRIEELTGIDFPDMTADDESIRLSRALDALPFVQEWAKAVQTEADETLRAGKCIPGYKLVQGRLGNRKWTDEAEVETVLRKQFRLSKEEVYNMKLISPTDAEKMFKDNPRRWETLLEYITRGPPSLIVVREDDKRPGVTPMTDFPNLEI